MCDVRTVFLLCYGYHRDLHVLTHSFPTRRSSDLLRSPIETESLSALRAMALSGDCYALLPRSSVHADVVSGKLMARRIVNPDLRGMMSVANLNGRELQIGRASCRSRVCQYV